MQAALNLLGYPCYHFFELYSNIDDCDWWSRAIDAKFFAKGQRFERKEWDQLLGNYAAVADCPCICFAPELIDAYPESKIVLCDRNIDAWYKSFDEAVVQSAFSPVLDYVAYLHPGFTGKLVWMSRKWRQGFFRAKDQKELAENAKDIFREHYANVRKITPPERLLEFDMATGWKPLCDFLGCEVPDKPFPRVNETAMLKEKLGIITRRSLMNGMKRVVVVGSVAMAAIVAWKWNMA
ncbi:hypothetical protein MMC12_007571 [Toensbergia leucococca]|nr:hypothetical protein [Toensbergia leucococca]